MPPHNDTKHNLVFGFLRDYAPTVPSVIAIMNGLLAIYATNYPIGTVAAKLGFVVIIGLLSLAAIAATIYSNHLVIAARAKGQARILAIREQLGIFIADGARLLNSAATISAALPIDQANEWAANVENFLATNMGDAYRVRFQDRIGMPPGILPESLIRRGSNDEHLMLWRWLYSRLMKLDQFIRESPW
jgi:hypothetical protein